MLRSVVAIVSGGASGLGAATASAIIARGGRVIVADLPSAKDNYWRLAASACAHEHMHHVGGNNHSGGGSVAEGIDCSVYSPYNSYGNDGGSKDQNDDKQGKGKPLIAFSEADVRNEYDIKNALDLAEDTFGEPVNVAVNCAGICPARRTISNRSLDSSKEIKVHSLDGKLKVYCELDLRLYKMYYLNFFT